MSYFCVSAIAAPQPTTVTVQTPASRREAETITVFLQFMEFGSIAEGKTT